MMTKKNILIVGASASIGGEIISVFYEKDCNILATYNKTKLHFKNKNINSVQLDIQDKKSRNDLFELINNIDVVVFLPGVLPGKNLEKYSDEEIESLINLNLSSQITTIKGILPKINKGGRILFLSSISGEKGSFDPIYAASKGGIIPFAKSLASWYGSKLRVNVIAPSLISKSSMYNNMSDERIDYHKKNSPTGELVDMKSLAKIIYDLAKPDWNISNGAVIRINGGQYV